MRSFFAIALLAVSTQAMKMPLAPADNAWAPTGQMSVNPQNLAQQNTTNTDPCANFTMPDMDQTVDWGQTFQGPSDWFNDAEGFWQFFSTESAFQYFDCAIGNGDGQVTFNELNDGLFQGGFTPNKNCSSEFFTDFQETYNTTGIAVNADEFGASFDEEQSNNFEALFNDTKSLNHNDWMRGAMRNIGLDALEAQLWWQAANTQKNNKNIVTATEFQNSQSAAQRGLWDFANTQKIALGDYMPSDLWYVTQGCASGEQWWSALTNTQQWTSWQSEISYDLTGWQADHCRNMGMCQGQSPKGSGSDSDSDSGSDSDSDSDSGNDSDSDSGNDINSGNDSGNDSESED